MRVGSIGTRYAAWIAALSFALVATALVAAGVIAFRESKLVQAEIHETVGTARAADEEAALRGAARPSAPTCSTPSPARRRALNRGSAGSEPGCPSSRSSFWTERRVLTGGTAANARYGDRVEGSAWRAAGPQLVRRGDGTELRFAISSGGVPASWAS
jgi:hypothetical protein